MGDKLGEGVGGRSGLRLMLVCCPRCGQHGVVVSYSRGSKFRAFHNVWTVNEVRDLHERLLIDGGNYQHGFMGELERADYLVDDYYPNELTGLTGLMFTLGVPAPCIEQVSVN